MYKSILFLLFTTNILISQDTIKYPQWEVGGFLGASYYQGDLSIEGAGALGLLPFTKPAYGLFIKRNVSRSIALKINYLSGGLQGREGIYTGSEIIQGNGFSFESPVTEFSMNLEWDVLSKKRTYKNHRRTISPYLIGGIGLQLTNPEVNWNGQSNGAILTDQNQISNSHFVIPYGLGVKGDLSSRVYLSVEGSARLIFSDYIDGISQSANPEDNDWNAFAGLTIGFRLDSTKDSDGDGIKDRMDHCPDLFGTKAFNGCPDSDGDGIVDSLDQCPNHPGKLIHQGCPDRDQDGIIDLNDPCPKTYGTIGGCPDTDSDGIIDINDDCPKIPGSIEGCPDTDGDKIIDSEDNCPLTAGLSKFMGCPDTDDDGIIDQDDACPRQAGPESNNGCPLVAKPVNHTEKIYFENASARIDKKEEEKLQRVLEMLLQDPDLNVELLGQADYRGESEYNTNLSNQRAVSVRDWLISMGITEDRITAKAIGEVEGEGKTDSDLQKYRSTVVRITNQK